MLSRVTSLLLFGHAFTTLAGPNAWDKYSAARSHEKVAARQDPAAAPAPVPQIQTGGDSSGQSLEDQFQADAGDLDLIPLYEQLLGNNASTVANLSDPGRQLSTLRHNGQAFAIYSGPDRYDVQVSECALDFHINIGSWTFSDGTTKDNVTMRDVLRDVKTVKDASGGSLTGVDILLDQAYATADGVLDDMQDWYNKNVCLFGTGSMTAEVANLTNGMRTLNQVDGNHWLLSIVTATAAGLTVWGAQEIAHSHDEFRQAANAISGFVPTMAAAIILWIGRRPRAPQALRDADAVAVAAAAAGLRRSSRGIRYGPRACFAAAMNALSSCLTGGGVAENGGLQPGNQVGDPAVGGGQLCAAGGDIEMQALNIGSADVAALGVQTAAAAGAQFASDNAQQFCDIYAS